MIIAISAAPPVDTSELAQKLAAQHNLKIHEDPAPQICKDYGFQTLYDMPYELQTEIRDKLISEHAALVSENNNLLLNYSIFNYLADWMRWHWAHTPTEKWERIQSLASEIVARYDKIYHVADGKQRDYNGYVWFDRRNAVQINKLLEYLYSELNVLDKLQT